MNTLKTITILSMSLLMTACNSEVEDSHDHLGDASDYAHQATAEELRILRPHIERFYSEMAQRNANVECVLSDDQYYVGDLQKPIVDDRIYDAIAFNKDMSCERRSIAFDKAAVHAESEYLAFLVAHELGHAAMGLDDKGPEQIEILEVGSPFYSQAKYKIANDPMGSKGATNVSDLCKWLPSYCWDVLAGVVQPVETDSSSTAVEKLAALALERSYRVVATEHGPAFSNYENASEEYEAARAGREDVTNDPAFALANATRASLVEAGFQVTNRPVYLFREHLYHIPQYRPYGIYVGAGQHTVFEEEDVVMFMRAHLKNQTDGRAACGQILNSVNCAVWFPN